MHNPNTPNPGTAELERKIDDIIYRRIGILSDHEEIRSEFLALIDQQRQQAKQEAMQELIDKVREGWEFRPGQEGQMVLDDMLRQRDALLGKETK